VTVANISANGAIPVEEGGHLPRRG
jgi:hypothetical protein